MRSHADRYWRTSDWLLANPPVATTTARACTSTTPDWSFLLVENRTPHTLPASSRMNPVAR